MLLREPETTFEPAPQGLHNAVCVDVVDLGEVETPWGSQPRMRLIWQLETRSEGGRRYQIAKQYKPSLHPKSSLRKDLMAWQGRALTPDELAGFETEGLIGRGCQLNVAHRPGNEGRVWANVSAIVPLPAGAPALEVDDYVRQCDRTDPIPY